MTSHCITLHYSTVLYVAALSPIHFYACTVIYNKQTAPSIQARGAPISAIAHLTAHTSHGFIHSQREWGRPNHHVETPSE